MMMALDRGCSSGDGGGYVDGDCGKKSKATSIAFEAEDLRRWSGLRLPVPCKHLLFGHDAQITCLTYLPLAMLLVSGAANGRVRLWDPCARRHRRAVNKLTGAGCVANVT